MPVLFPKFISAGEVIQIVSFAVIPITINYMYISKFLGSENNKIVVISSIIYAVTQISGIVILGNLFDIRGIAIAFVLAASLEALFLFIMDHFNKNKKLSA